MTKKFEELKRHLIGQFIDNTTILNVGGEDVCRVGGIKNHYWIECVTDVGIYPVVVEKSLYKNHKGSWEKFVLSKIPTAYCFSEYELREMTIGESALDDL